MKLYVGNVSFNTREEELGGLFEQYGDVSSVSIIFDRITGRSRGFGFVEMPNDEQARKAIEELNGKELDGRPIRVDVSRPRTGGRNDRSYR